MTDIAHLASLRRDLAEARVALREAERTEKVWKARYEIGIIADIERNAPAGTKPGTALGVNKEDRERTLTEALGNHEEYLSDVSEVTTAQNKVERLTAEIAGIEDELREARRLTLERYCDTLLAVQGADIFVGGRI